MGPVAVNTGRKQVHSILYTTTTKGGLLGRGIRREDFGGGSYEVV